MHEPWPHVLDEWETLAVISQGRSLARYGNAEVSLLNAQPAYLEDPDPALVAELRQVVKSPHPKCLVGIPRLDPQGPKYHGLCKRASGLRPWLDMHQQYGSTHISRPDCAPWVTQPSYITAMDHLWHGKKIALVCTPENPLCRVLGYSAHKVIFIGCAARNAYRDIAVLEQEAVSSRAELVILSCGATAACLANRLTGQGCQAIDVGAMGEILLASRLMRHVNTTLVAVRHPIGTGRVLQHTLEQAGCIVEWMSDAVTTEGDPC